MSKTVDDLRSDYNRGFWSVPETDGLQAQQNAGIAAVVRAVRDEICKQYGFRKIWDDFDNILGDAGEKVAGGTSREQVAPEGVTLTCSTPATDPVYTGGMNDLCVTAPAPAVCVWTDVGDKYRSACGRSHFAWTSREGVVVCPECKAPIKFTEAQR